MMGCAVLFGLLAVFVARAWLSSQAELRAKSEPRPAAIATRNVVVAASPLRFGIPLSAPALREVAWPEGAVPANTFSSIEEVLAAGKRIVLSSIEQNEPVLRWKITGPGQ